MPRSAVFYSLDLVILQIMGYGPESTRWRTNHRGECPRWLRAGQQHLGAGLVRTAQPYERRPVPPAWIKEQVESQRRALLLPCFSPVSAGWSSGWAQEQSGDPKPLELRNRQTPSSQGPLPAAQQSTLRPTSFHQVSWAGFPITEPLHDHRTSSTRCSGGQGSACAPGCSQTRGGGDLLFTEPSGQVESAPAFRLSLSLSLRVLPAPHPPGPFTSGSPTSLDFEPSCLSRGSEPQSFSNMQRVTGGHFSPSLFKPQGYSDLLYPASSPRPPHPPSLPPRLFLPPLCPFSCFLSLSPHVLIFLNYSVILLSISFDHITAQKFLLDSLRNRDKLSLIHWMLCCA